MLTHIKPLRTITLSMRMLCILGIALIAPLLACNDNNGEVIPEDAVEKSDIFSDATGGRVGKSSKPSLPRGPNLTIAATSIKFSGNDSDIVDIPIHIAGAPDLAGVQFELLYDPASLQFEEIIPGALIKDFIFEAAANQTTGVISVAAISMHDSNGTGELAIAKFKPLKENKLQIKIQNLIMADSNLKPIDVTHKPADITIQEINQRAPKQIEKNQTTAPSKRQPPEIPKRSIERKATVVPDNIKPTTIPKRSTGRDATAAPSRR